MKEIAEKQQRAITHNISNVELWFLCTALLFGEIYLPMKFHYASYFTFRDMLRTKSKSEKQQRAITHKKASQSYAFVPCTFLLKFHDPGYFTFRDKLQTRFKSEKQQRAITHKISQAELCFLYPALLFGEIYPTMKFHYPSYFTFRDILRTKSKSEK